VFAALQRRCEAHGDFGVKLTVETTLRARQVYPLKLTDLCSAANGRSMPVPDSCTAQEFAGTYGVSKPLAVKACLNRR
jgi:hypothetical protein